MNDETYTPCTKCGRPLSYCKGQCCGKPKGCQCKEYGPKVCGAIRPGEPHCPYQAVIPSLTVESVSNLKDLADCFVHVSDINTTFYIDDKHRIMTTWAGLVSVEDYDFVANPLNLRGQIAYDAKNNVAAIYDKQGANYIFQISDINNNYMLLENKPQINGVTLEGNKTSADLGIPDIDEVALVFDTVADMKSATNLVNGGYARTLGFHSLNDGGGALYKISDTGTANEMDVIAVDTLRAHLIADRINVKQYGAYGDSTHDDTTILSTILQNITDNKIVYLPNGTYLCETDINVTANNIKIYGDGQLQSIIDFNDNGSITFNGHGNILNDLQFRNQDKVEFDGYHNVIKNVNCYSGNYGLLLKDAYITQVENCYITHNTVGIVADNQSYEVVVNDCVIDNNKLGILALGTSGIRVNGCTIEGNRDTSNNIGCGVALATSSLDVSIENCWLESNGTSSDSADIVILYDIEDGTLGNLYTQLHTYYTFTNTNNPGSLKLNNNHHLYTQYAVATGGYNTEVYITNCYFKGTLGKNNKPVLIGGRNNVLHYLKLICKNNMVLNTDNVAITTEMLNGIKGSYIYTNTTYQTQDKSYLLGTSNYVLDEEPLFVYMPFINELTTVKYLKQWQSGGTSYNSGMLYGNITNSYPTTSPALYLTLDGTSSTVNIFTSTGETTYSFLQEANSTVTVRRDNNVVQSVVPLAEGYMPIRTDNLYNQQAFAYKANTTIFALVEFSAAEKKACKQCIAMKPKDYYPSIIPPTA